MATPTLLAHTQIPATKGDIYAPTSGVVGVVHNIMVHNTNTTDEDVQIYITDGTTEYKFYYITLPANDTFVPDFRGEGLVINGTNGAKITAVTTTAAKVNITLHGSVL